MRCALVLAIAACSSPTPKPTVQLTTSFDVTEFLGHGPSQLDPLQGQTISFTVTLDDTGISTGSPDSDPMGCKSRTAYDATPKSVAMGANADVVQMELLDVLAEWDVTLQLCTTASSSSILMVSEPDAFNLAFGCPVPEVAQVSGGDGYPEFTSFVAQHCNATILDVGGNRTLGNPDFSVTIGVSPPSLP